MLSENVSKINVCRYFEENWPLDDDRICKKTDPRENPERNPDSMDDKGFIGGSWYRSPTAIIRMPAKF